MALALTNKTDLSNTPPPPQHITQRCPSCHQVGQLTYAGDQHIPPRVAQNLNLPTVLQLWECPNCQTTISHPALEKMD